MAEFNYMILIDPAVHPSRNAAEADAYFKLREKVGQEPGWRFGFCKDETTGMWRGWVWHPGHHDAPVR